MRCKPSKQNNLPGSRVDDTILGPAHHFLTRPAAGLSGIQASEPTGRAGELGQDAGNYGSGLVIL